MNKALFVDRDGVLNQDTGYTYKISDLVILEGVIEGLKFFQDQGYLIIIITNQSGIARGFFTPKDLANFMNKMCEIFESNQIYIRDYYFCPHHFSGSIKKYAQSCNCRKPNTGMIISAAKKYDIDLSKSVLIGDKESDILAGKNSGIFTNLLILDDFLPEGSQACATAKDLVQAASIIEKLN
jgi:D,D-heptose 1,7-bisphosphate phosphatase|tara:strand:+ start:754 stop:1299 length:546 start_codon:yes stop_codon:yes gene_type:complete